MDKETLSNYGWIVICVMVLAVMLAFASPFGNFVANAIKSTTQGLFDVNQNALDSAGIEIMEQEFEEMLNGPSATDSPVKFGQPYQITMDGMLMEYVFYADGSATMWMADAMGGYMPAGSVTYTETEVILEGDPVKISADGTYLYDPEDETFKMTVKSVPSGKPKTNTTYIADPNGLIGITGVSVSIGSDGSLTMYQNGTTGETIPASAITWYDNYFVVKEEGQEDLTGAIYPDGSKITIGEIVCVNIGDCAGVQFNKPYEYTHETGEIYTLTFYENGSFKIEVDGSVIISEDAGAATYSPTYIDSNTYKFSVSIDGTQVTLLNTRWVFELGQGNFVNYAFTASDYDAKMGTTTKTDAVVVIPEAFEYNGKTYKVTSIGERAFENCKNLTSVTIPNTVKGIGVFAFGSCDKLQTIDIPNSVTRIGVGAFYHCNNITSITIPESVTQIHERAFSYLDKLENIYVATGNQKFCSVDGILFNKDMTKIVCYPEAKTATTYAIPNTVTTIGVFAFTQCDNLTQITIPNSVTTIEGYAFSASANLSSITIPASVTTIGNRPFEMCYRVESINVASDNQNFCSVEGVLFSKDMKTLIRYPSKNTSTAYTIPEGVTKISAAAFDCCDNLVTVIIPTSVTEIGNAAFDNWDNNGVLNYTGTEEQWNAISLDPYWTIFLEYTLNFNYTGE